MRLALAVGAIALGAASASGATTQPPFSSAVSPLPAAMRAHMVSWRAGCPVALSALRLVTVSRFGFDGRVHSGQLIVARDVADAVVGIMRRLFAARFPIRRMEPVDVFGGSDFRSIEADNTSAFNCRFVDGTRRFSEHAYGRAIDLDPLENPSVSGGSTSHRASEPYLDRSRRAPGMIHAGDAVVRAFAAAGWQWGGRWVGSPDYQHFSASGR